MKQVKKKFAIIFLFTLFISTTKVFASGAKLPTLDTGDLTTVTDNQNSDNTPTPTPPAPKPSPPAPPTSTNPGPYVDQITSLASASSCAKYSWKNRGKAPAGYIKGVALTFARSLCRLKNDEANPTSLVKILSAANSHNASKDALAHYQSSFASKGMEIEIQGEEPLRALYVLGMGLGMRESSGVYCEGWDRSAGSSRPSSAGEAGLFQTSYDSMGVSPEFRKLYNEYLANPGRCFLNVFKQGASCSDNSVLGTGAGADYQRFNKACPAFATEYAMTMLRILRAHYGPINRKEAEVTPACDQLLRDVQELVDRDPQNACDDIL